MSSRELVLLLTFQSVWNYWEEFLTPSVTQLTEKDQLNLPNVKELKLKPQESFQENLSTNLCKLVSRLLTPSSQLAEVKENLLLVIDKLERLLLLLTQLLTKSKTSIPELKINNFTAFMLLLVKKDLQLQVLSQT